MQTARTNRPTEFTSVGEVIVHYSRKYTYLAPTDLVSVGRMIRGVALVLESSAPPTQVRLLKN